MTRMKKKMPSVAGHKFVPIKQEKRDTADSDEYKARKRKNLTKKKRHASTYEKTKQVGVASASAQGQQTGAAQRSSRLKHSPAEVEQVSKDILKSDATEEPTA